MSINDTVSGVPDINGWHGMSYFRSHYITLLVKFQIAMNGTVCIFSDFIRCHWKPFSNFNLYDQKKCCSLRISFHETSIRQNVKESSSCWIENRMVCCKSWLNNCEGKLEQNKYMEGRAIFFTVAKAFKWDFKLNKKIHIRFCQIRIRYK